MGKIAEQSNRGEVIIYQSATQRIRKYIVKGFAIDDERLKGNAGGKWGIICTPVRMHTKAPSKSRFVGTNCPQVV